MLSPAERSGSVPDWLAGIEAPLPARLPLKELLAGSLYYPAAGCDGDPVALLSGRVFSFVYVDYGVTRQALDRALKQNGFAGYRIIGRRRVRQEELAPHSWTPPIRPDAAELTRMRNIPGFIRREPYCEWLIFERAPGRDAGHGAFRFSLLYLLADGAAAYQALYGRLGMAPAILAIIQPGHGFGGNYSDYGAPGSLLHRSVMSAGGSKPMALLTGWYTGPELEEPVPVWPEFPVLRACAKTRQHDLYLWERGSGDDVPAREDPG